MVEIKQSAPFDPVAVSNEFHSYETRQFSKNVSEGRNCETLSYESLHRNTPRTHCAHTIVRQRSFVHDKWTSRVFNPLDFRSRRRCPNTARGPRYSRAHVHHPIGPGPRQNFSFSRRGDPTQRPGVTFILCCYDCFQFFNFQHLPRSALTMFWSLVALSAMGATHGPTRAFKFNSRV